MNESKLTPQEQQKKAIKRAMYLLQKQDRTKQQLTDKLKQDGYEESIVLMAIDYVESYRYLDDDRYARNYIRYGSEHKSRQKLKISLLQKGVSQEIVERALEEEYEGDEKAQIRTLLTKKKYLPGETSREETQKIMASIFRKGFRIEDIKAVMGEVDE